MDDQSRSSRRTLVGVAVLLAVALALVALPRGGDVIDVVSATVQAVFLAAFAWTGAVMYRTRSGWLAELPDRDRGVLYGALALALLAIVGHGRFAEVAGSAGQLLWYAVLAACGLAVYWVWRESRRFMV